MGSLSSGKSSVSVLGVSVSVLGLLGGFGVLANAYWLASVWLVLLAVGAPALAVVVVAWNSAEDARREFVKRRALVGMVAGAAGLVVYDLSRWSVVWVGGLDVNPFEAIPVFGELLIGSLAGDQATWVAGFGYHVFNGVGFAMFYSLLIGRKGILAGVGWAFLLEVVTLFVYPGWLDIKARGEFTAVSLAGHVGYGVALGYLAKRLLRGES